LLGVAETGTNAKPMTLVDPARVAIGHNGGPPLEDPATEHGTGWHLYCWRRACQEAWKPPPREVMLRRLRRAEELGMTYREYTAVILDRGIHL